MDEAVAKYLEDLPEHRKKTLQALHSTILDLFPEIVIDMRYKMPTYHQGGGWVALANQKNYISLYTCGYHHIESFKAKHPKIKTGKGCINFKDRDTIPIEDLKPVIQHAILHPKPAKTE